MSALIMSAIRRLEQEQYDDAISCIDLRGKHCSEISEETSVPRPQDVFRLARAIHNYSCRLKVLSMHTNFLSRHDMPALFDVLVDLPLLEKLVIFHHDLADDMLGLLLRALTGSNDKGYAKQNPYAEKEPFASPGDSDTGLHAKSSFNKTDCVCSLSLYSELTQSLPLGLKELYLSHCNIGCIGASRIAESLVSSSISNGGQATENNKLKYLRVLSLGSNRIKKDGATSLAKAFGLCPMHRLVLHGNQDLASSDANDLFRYALIPDGWQQSASRACRKEIAEDRSKFHSTPMFIITPLIFDYVRNRWVTDHVLVRPYELTRKRLLEEIYKKNSCYVDDCIDQMPEVLSWMARVGTCSRPPNSQSQLGNNAGRLTQLVMCHSDECNECRACKNIHFNDVFMLMRKLPHLAEWFRNMRATVDIKKIYS